MSKVSYTNLKLKINTEVNKIEGTDIEVLKYLPIEDKITLINLTLQQSKENGIFNTALIDTYFHLYIAMLYTNITFTDKQKEEPLKIYNVLKSNGLLDKIILAMEEDEYNQLNNYLNQQIEDIYNYKNTIGGVVSEIIEQLPLQAEEMQKIVDNFDKEKFANVLEFAKAANGGREL